jgi:dTDP-4-amino-4,6-dideoxygalactose transaminase
MKIEFYRHNLDEKDIQNTVKVLRSTFLTTGPIAHKFEEQFSQYTDLEHTIGLNSCTAALHLSLLSLDIGPGDEVIVSPMTFIATATAILHTGAKPVFIDVEKESGLMDVNSVEQAITRRTKAILPVHLYGSMVDMKGLKKIADHYGLKIIEDCAHCVEGVRDGIRPGQLGDAACYSFYATKNLTCGEGGAVGTNDSELADKVRVLRLHGMSKDAITRYSNHYQHWDMISLGWKYNMDDIHASLLIGQIDSIDRYWKRRDEISKSYDKAFASIPSITIPKRYDKSAAHLYTIWVDARKRDEFLHNLQGKNIGVAVNYRSIHTLNYFKSTYGFKTYDFPNANLIGESTISLPLYPKLKDTEIDYIIESVKTVVEPSIYC